MASQIRNIIAERQDFLVGTNEDWTDGWVFSVAGAVASGADDGNKGNGSIGQTAVAPTTPTGLYRVVIADIENGAAFFTLSSRTTDGDQDLAAGVAGLPVEAQGLRFTLQAGATPFVVGDGFSLSVLPALQDISGIAFYADLRRSPGPGARYPATPALRASTEASTLLNGGTTGVLSTRVALAVLAGIQPDTYDYDLIAVADGIKRRVRYGTVQIPEGVTRLL